MDAFTTNDLKPLLARHEPPCLSVYLPTQRGFGDKNAVAWRNRIDEADALLKAAGVEETARKKRLTLARRLEANLDFWRHQGDGFAWFQAGEFARGFRLPLAFAAKTTCGPSFRVTPLLELLGDNGGFYVLAISQKRVRLLHGTMFGLTEVELTGVPASLAEALRTHDNDEQISFHGLRPGTGAWGSVFYGQGGSFDQHKGDLLRYFQLVDRGLHDFLRNEKAPLFLAAVDSVWPIYREANTYAHLHREGIGGNPDHTPDAKLHEAAWQLAAPLFRRPRQLALAKFAEFAGTGRTADDREHVLFAAHAGAVETLLLDRSAEWEGAYNPVTGAVSNDRPSAAEDLVNLAAVETVRHGGAVHVCAAAEMPGGVALAALLRQPAVPPRATAAV